MKAYLEPLERLHESLRWFVAVPGIRLLHVTVGSELRMASLEKIAHAETSPHNRSPFVFAETPAGNDPSEWAARADEIGEDFAAARERAAKATPPIALALPSIGQAPSDGLARFTQTVRAQIESVRQPLDGLMVVLAPTDVSNGAGWTRDLRALLTDPRIAKARFIIVEPEPAPALALAVELGDYAERVDVRVDPKATDRTLASMLAGMKTAPFGAEGIRLAGMAGPREAPPPRLGRTAPSRDAAGAELAAAGVAPAMADPQIMQPLRIELMSASLAQQRGETEQAIRHQVAARDMAVAAGLVRESIVLELILGAHLVQASAFPQAQSVFDQAVVRAGQSGLGDLEAQGHMGKAGALLAQRRPEDAARSYGDGAGAAEKSGAKPLAIECHRMVGQILLGLRNESDAAAAFKRALDLAEGTPIPERAASSAPVAARDLAAVYRRHGMDVHADSLEAQAERWETEALPAGSGAGA